jgi:hypothetical protein
LTPDSTGQNHCAAVLGRPAIVEYTDERSQSRRQLEVTRFRFQFAFLPQWKKLVGVLVDAGPEWGLEQVPICGGRGIPTERAQIGGEYARIVGAELSDVGSAFITQNRAVELRVPQHLDRLALSVIIHAG